MKTYKYSKCSFFIQLFLIAGLITLLLYFEYMFNKSRFVNRVFFLAVFLIASTPFVISIFKRKIILNTEHVEFISFFNSVYTSKKERDFSVMYRYITKIERKKSIIPQKISLKITVKGRSKPIFVEYNMVGYKELFRNLCVKVQEFNPNVYIESEIWEYI